MGRKDAVTGYHRVCGLYSHFLVRLSRPFSGSDTSLPLLRMESSALPRPVASPLPARPTALLRHRHLSAFRLLPLHSSSPISYARRALSPLPLPLAPCRVKPSLQLVRASSSPSIAAPNPESTPAPSPQPAQGAKPVPLAISLAVGLAVRFLVPRPVEVTPQAWQLLAIFLSTIAGLVLSPLPVGAWAFIGLTASVITKTLTFSAAFGAFTNEVIWLIVISFFFARGFVKTGLGDRIATYFVKWLGKSTLGLSYGLTVSEAFIAPAMPSTTARAGGVFLPIIKSLSLSSGSKPGDRSAGKLGSYLVMSQFQVSASSCLLGVTSFALLFALCSNMYETVVFQENYTCCQLTVNDTLLDTEATFCLFFLFLLPFIRGSYQPTEFIILMRKMAIKFFFPENLSHTVRTNVMDTKISFMMTSCLLPSICCKLRLRYIMLPWHGVPRARLIGMKEWCFCQWHMTSIAGWQHKCLQFPQGSVYWCHLTFYLHHHVE